MSVPARKKSTPAGKRRRSHVHVDPINTGVCEQCKKPVVSHRACTSCGFYKGRQVIDQSRQTKRAVKRMETAHHHDHEASEA
jgi:large subunit ribosomal protein L32